MSLVPSNSSAAPAGRGSSSAPRSAGRPVVVFDRDNTLIISDGYLGDPAAVKLMPGAADAVARARALGYAVAVVSNQSGVARGLFTEEDVRAVDRRMAELLLAENPGAALDLQVFCPFHPAAAVPGYRQDSELRKPKPGMFLQVLAELKATAGWTVGDAPRDIAAGRAAGLRTILFKPQGIPTSPAAEETATASVATGAGGPAQSVEAAAGVDPGPEFVVTSLDQAMSLIERETPGGQISGTSPATSAPAKPAAGSGPRAAPAPAAPAPASAATASPSVASTASPESPRTPEATRPLDTARLERQLDQIVAELKKANIPDTEFSIAKLLAGVVQIIVLALCVIVYLKWDKPGTTLLLLGGILLQCLVTSLLVMGRQR